MPGVLAAKRRAAGSWPDVMADAMATGGLRSAMIELGGMALGMCDNAVVVMRFWGRRVLGCKF